MATDLPTAIAAMAPRAGTPVPALAQPGLPPGTITLGGGFSPVNGMEFLGQSEAKGSALSKCQRLFNVREIRKPGENFVITGRILKTTTVKEDWNVRFTRHKVFRAKPGIGTW